MRTDVACDKLCDIAPLISELALKSRKDLELHKMLVASVQSQDNLQQIKFFAQLIKQSKYEILSILGIWFDKTYEEIAAQDFMRETLPMLKELWKDADIKSFFTSFIPTEQAVQTEEVEAAEELSPTSEPIAVATEAENVTSNQYADI